MAEEDSALAEDVLAEPQIRYAGHVWLGTLFKKTIDATAGRGGIEAFCSFLDKVHWIPEIVKLRMEMKKKSLDFELAMAKCSKERRLKLPERRREDEAFDFLGVSCMGCGFQTTFEAESKLKGKCPHCGGKTEPLYFHILEKFFQRGLSPTPEALIMDAYYDRLTDAYVATYKAWKMLLDREAQKHGWESFRLDNPGYRNYLDEFDLGRLVGETKIPREEKQVFQFIALGPIAGIELEEAERLIRACMEVVKYGGLSQEYGVDGAIVLYEQALRRKETLYDSLNEKINAILVQLYAEESQPTVKVSEPNGTGRYPPMFLMPPEYWATGTVSRQFELAPLHDLPVFPKADLGALQTVYGLVGSGKTILLSSIFCHSIRTKRELVFTPLGDMSNSFTLACMPLFKYSRNTSGLLKLLEKKVGVDPQGVPVLTLTFLRKGEERFLNERKNPPTKYDRVVEVDNPVSFTFDFKIALKELKVIAEEYGHNRPVGIITVRNLLEERFDRDINVNTDVQIAANMLGQYDIWRKSDLSLPARVFIDEVATLARTKISLYARDILRSGETILSFIAESRRSRVSIDLSTQMPLEILPNIRDAATNVFFRNLPMSHDKSRSQIDYLLESLQFYDPAVRAVIRDLNNRGLLGTGFWFWYHRPARSVQIVNPSPPTFCIQDPEAGLSNFEIFRQYEKQSGKQILLDGWSQVKRLETETDTTGLAQIR